MRNSKAQQQEFFYIPSSNNLCDRKKIESVTSDIIERHTRNVSSFRFQRPVIFLSGVCDGWNCQSGYIICSSLIGRLDMCFKIYLRVSREKGVLQH